LRFSQGAGLTVNGSLRSLGTAGAPVLLTANTGSPTPGYWAGLALYGSGGQLDHTTIEWGTWGIYGNPFYSASQQISLDGAVVRGSYYDGLRLDGSAALTLTGSTVRDSAGRGLALNARDGSVALDGSTIASNGLEGLSAC